MNGREEGGQYYILQTCDQERFEARKVVFPWQCLIIFATGCSFIFHSVITSAEREVKDSRRSGMFQSCFLGTILGTQSPWVFDLNGLFDEVRAELLRGISRSLRVL